MFECKITFNEFKERLSKKNLERSNDGIVFEFDTPFEHYEFQYSFKYGALILGSSGMVRIDAWYVTGINDYNFSDDVLMDMYTFFKNQYEYVLTKDVDGYNYETIENYLKDNCAMECDVYSYEGNHYIVKAEYLVNVGFFVNLYNDADDKIAVTELANPIKIFRWIQGEIEYYEEMGEEVDEEIDEEEEVVE